MKVGRINSKYISGSLRFNSDFHLSEGVEYDRLLRNNNHEILQNLTTDIFCAGRSKRIYVDEGKGYPYLGNIDISSTSPLSGCNYASKKYWNESKGFLEEGMILTGRVGQNTVGSFSYATEELEGCIGSDNVIRLISNKTVKNGYLYSFLASKYGHHLARRHISGNAQPFITEDMLADMPIPLFSEVKQQEIHNLIEEVARLRVEANKLLRDAVIYFEEFIVATKVQLGFQTGQINSKSLNTFHKRLDGQFQLLWKDLKKEKKEGVNYYDLCSFAKSIFVGGRGKRLYTDSGVPFLSSSDMMMFNPKRVCKKVSKNTPGLQSMIVNKYDILISRSGTVGNTVLVGDDLADTAISEHALRLIIDSEKISPNYVFCFLKTKYGMKCMEASSFGSVIITLNEDLIGNIELPVLGDNHQEIINDKVEMYLSKLDESTLKENQAINLIEKEIESWQVA